MGKNKEDSVCPAGIFHTGLPYRMWEFEVSGFKFGVSGLDIPKLYTPQP